MSKKKWKDSCFIALDLETTGAYPLSASICEIGAVKWREGKVVETFETLICPPEPMEAEVIQVHGITNDMVKGQPTIDEKIGEFYDFIKEDYLVAHHASFDIGFLAWEFEKAQLPLPEKLAFCSSLLAQKFIKDSPNARLQTLVHYLKLEKRTAHRAAGDAEACLEVALECFQRFNEDATVEELLKEQPSQMKWSEFSINFLKKEEKWTALFKAIEEKKEVNLVYNGGSQPGVSRTVKPLGIVRNPDRDYLSAIDVNGERRKKRYYLDQIQSCSEV